MENNAAVQRSGCLHRGQRIAVGVAVVAEHAGTRHVQYPVVEQSV
jgi:hypothetical protein